MCSCLCAPTTAGADPGFSGTLLAPSNCYWKHLLADLDVTEAMLLQQSNALNTLVLVRCSLCCAVLRHMAGWPGKCAAIMHARKMCSCAGSSGLPWHAAAPTRGGHIRMLLFACQCKPLWNRHRLPL